MFDQKQDPPTSRSPLKHPQLRLPGQSLDEELQRLIDEEALSLAAGVIFVIMFTVYEWLRWGLSIQPHPYEVTIGGILCLAYCYRRFLRFRRQARSIRLGRDGEREVGQVLEELRAEGAVVFHDVPGDGFNVDHVVVSRFGVFAIETKTVSKRGKDPQIDFDGERLVVPGVREPVAFLSQAGAEARWLRDLLTEMSGRPVGVQPVLVFPGWWVNGPRSLRSDQTWVLNPKALLTFIPALGERLIEERVRELAHHLRQHVMNRQRAAG